MTGSNNINMQSYFGSFCADGGRALSFLNRTVSPMIDLDVQVILDFDGVRNMNTSFSNALFGNLGRRYGKDFFNYVSCINLRDNVRREIITGVKMGSVNNDKAADVIPTVAFSKHVYT